MEANTHELENPFAGLEERALDESIEQSRKIASSIHAASIKAQLKEVLRANGMYVGSSKAAALLRELADEYDD